MGALKVFFYTLLVSFTFMVKIARSDEFTILHNQDLVGTDIRTPITEPHLKGITLKSCEESCRNEESCTAFTYDVKNQWCFLKAGHLEFKPTINAVSGIRSFTSSSNKRVNGDLLDRKKYT